MEGGHADARRRMPSGQIGVGDLGEIKNARKGFAADVSDDALEVDEAPGFLPLEIEGVVSSPGRPQNSVSAAVVPGAVSAQRVDITLSDGRRILVEGVTGLGSVLALVEGLMI